MKYKKKKKPEESISAGLKCSEENHVHGQTDATPCALVNT